MSQQPTSCAVCKKGFDGEVTVVAFGDALIHNTCFKCVKCGSKLNPEKGAMLADETGMPLCPDCGDKCVACGMPILDDAVPAGDSIYHLTCFKCIVCGHRIDNQGFTKKGKNLTCSSCTSKRSPPGTVVVPEQTSPNKDPFRDPVPSSKSIPEAPTTPTRTNSAPTKPSQTETGRVESKTPSFKATTTTNTSIAQSKTDSPISRSVGNAGPSVSTVKDAGLEARLAKMRARAEGLGPENSTTTTTVPHNVSPSNDLGKSPLAGSAAKDSPQPPKSTTPKDSTAVKSPEPSQASVKSKFERSESPSRDNSQRAKVQIPESVVAAESQKAPLQQQQQQQQPPIQLPSSPNPLATAERQPSPERSASPDRALASEDKDLRTQISKLKEELKALQSQKTTLQDEISDIQQVRNEMQQLQQQRTSIQRELQELQRQRDLARSTQETHIKNQAESTVANVKLEKLEASYASLKQEHESLRSECEALRASLATHQTQLETCRKANEFQLHIHSLEETRDKLQREIDERSILLRQVYEETQGLQGDIEQLQNLKNSLHDEVASLTSKVSEMNANKPVEKPLIDSTSASSQASSMVDSSLLNRPVPPLPPQANARQLNSNGYAMLGDDSPLLGNSSDDSSRNRLAKLKGKVNEEIRGLKKKNKMGSNENIEHNSKPSSVKSLIRASIRNVIGSNSSSSVVNKQATTTKLVFGAHINDLTTPEDLIPTIVRVCVAAVELRGMEYEGIYRKSGPSTLINKIAAAFQRGEIPNLNDEDEWNDITAVTSALKKFFMEMQDCLLTEELYQQWITVGKITEEEQKFYETRRLIYFLPLPNRFTLTFLMQHLSQICSMSAINKMSASNLGVVWGPSLLKTNAAEVQQMMTDSGTKIQLVEYMVNNAEPLFGDVYENANWNGQSSTQEPHDPFSDHNAAS